MALRMDTTQGMRDVYRHHHTTGNRLGKSVLSEVRGAFFREKIGTGKKILDVGCRDGVLTKAFASGNEVLGLDIDDEALAIAERELGIVTKQVDLNGDWGFPARTFDAVVASEVIEHLYFPDRVLEKIANALKDDGVLLGSVPNAFSVQMRTRLFLGKKRATPLNDPTHINHFSHGEMKELLQEYFKDVRMYPVGNYAWLDPLWPGMFSFGLLFEARNPKR